MHRWIFEIVILQRQKVIKYFGWLYNWQISVPFQTNMGHGNLYKPTKSTSCGVLKLPMIERDNQGSGRRGVQRCKNGWVCCSVVFTFALCHNYLHISWTTVDTQLIVIFKNRKTVTCSFAKRSRIAAPP